MAYGGLGDAPTISTAGGTKSARASISRTSATIGSRSGGQTVPSSADVSALGVNRNESSSLFSEDESFDKQFDPPEDRIEIDAPPGKLGVVIDTPNGGVPLVHAIKDTSVLADRIRVNDKLVSVDGEDTTTMSAVKVSRLISSRADNPRRILVFVRNHRAE